MVTMSEPAREQSQKHVHVVARKKSESDLRPGSHHSWHSNSPGPPKSPVKHHNCADGTVNPSPPPHPRPPSSRNHRPKSGRGQRPISSRSSSSESDMRPRSASLSKFQVLPAIGKNVDSDSVTDVLNEETRKLSLTDDAVKDGVNTSGIIHRIPTAELGTSNTEDTRIKSGKRKCSSKDGQIRKSMRIIKLNKEPSDEEPRLQLGIKLTDGRNVRRYFRLTEPLQTVLDYAELEMGIDLSGYILITNTPTTEYKDLRQLIKDTDLKDKTLMYLQTPE